MSIITNNGVLNASGRSLSQVLSDLLLNKKIKPAELARLTNVPQPTIHRIVSGSSNKPHKSSLVPIAEYFSVSIDQLLGLKPILWLDANSNFENIKTIPLLGWGDVGQWQEGKLPEEVKSSFEKVITETSAGVNAYGLKIKDASMEPIFSIGSTIIIDPDRPVKDRGYVVVQLADASEPMLRRILVDGSHHYIKAISPALAIKLHKLEKNDKIHGVLTQVKRNFDD